MKEYKTPNALPVLLQTEDVIASSGVFFEIYEEDQGDRVSFDKLAGFFELY